MNKYSALQKEDTLDVTIYDAGGGSGKQHLNFSTLSSGQHDMFHRTISQLSDFEKSCRAQESRQLTLVDVPIHITITISREDFPDISAKFDITFVATAAQQAWGQLIKDVISKLKVDFVHSILDKVDKSPVWRVARFIHGGEYLVRQRESSAILEVINTGINPVDVSWAITRDIADVKQGLAFEERNMPAVERRVRTLVNRKMTREVQRELAVAIAQSQSPDAAVALVEQFFELYDPDKAECNSEAFVASLLSSTSAAVDSTDDRDDTNTAAIVDIGGFGFGSAKAVNSKNSSSSKTTAAVSAVNGASTYELPSFTASIARCRDCIDVVCIHRICLEKLGIFVADGRGKEVSDFQCLSYIRAVIADFRSEVDVVSLGLKVITEIMRYLKDYRETMLHLIMDCITAYAPPAAAHRPRDPLRLKQPEEINFHSLQLQQMLPLKAVTVAATPLRMKTATAAAGGVSGRIGSRGGKRSNKNNNHNNNNSSSDNGDEHMSDAMRQLGVVNIQDDAGDSCLSLSRYGNFYGQSMPPKKEAAQQLSQSVVRSDVAFPAVAADGSGAGSIAHVTSRVLTSDGRHRPVGDDLIVMSAATPLNDDSANDSNAGAEETVQQPEKPVEVDAVPLARPKVLIRGRERAGRAATATTATTAASVAGVAVTTASPSGVSAIDSKVFTSAAGLAPSEKLRPASAGRGLDYNFNTDDVNDAVIAAVAGVDSSGNSERVKRPQVAFRIKSSNSNNNNSSGRGGVSSSSKKQRAVWKGTVGELGRAAPKREEEIKIDFKKKIVYDPNQDSEHLAENAAVVEDKAVAVPSIVSVDGAVVPLIADITSSSSSKGQQHMQQRTSDVSENEIAKSGSGSGQPSTAAAADLNAEAESIPLAPSQMMRSASAVAAAATTTEQSTSLPAAVAAASPTRRRRRVPKGTYTPLPVVPCVLFRGLSGRLKQNIAMQQSFATLYKFISFSFGNRDRAFKMGIAEELAVVATVCQSMPRVLEYFLWTIDALYRDGFGEMMFEDMEGNPVEDPSMVVSAGNSITAATAVTTTAGDNISVDTMTGIVIETISEMSLPSIDADGVRSEATPVVSIGSVAAAEEEDDDESRLRQQYEEENGGGGSSGKFRRSSSVRLTRMQSQRSGITSSGASSLGTADAVDKNIRVEEKNQQRRNKHKQLVELIGLFEFEARYVKPPHDSIVIAVAMVLAHNEIETREQQMASRWLETWDDNSRRYKLLRKKGQDLAGL